MRAGAALPAAARREQVVAAQLDCALQGAAVPCVVKAAAVVACELAWPRPAPVWPLALAHRQLGHLAVAMQRLQLVRLRVLLMPVRQRCCSGQRGDVPALEVWLVAVTERTSAAGCAAAVHAFVRVVWRLLAQAAAPPSAARWGRPLGSDV